MLSTFLKLAQDIDNSTTRVSNTMVHNPIYDGPVYESVECPVETHTNQQATGIDDMSGAPNHSMSHTFTPPNNLLGTPRYVDQPKDFQTSQFQSKTFFPKVHTLASHNAASSSQSTSTFSEPKRVMAIKRSGQQHNKLQFTDTSHNSGNNARSTALVQGSLLGTVELRSEQAMCVNQTLLSDLEESYTVMSPAGSLARSVIV